MKRRKTLTEYVEQTIKERFSFISIDKEDIDRGDKDIKDMISSLIKSMTASKLYIYVKLTADGIRFTYNKHTCYLKNEGDGWILKNQTMKEYLLSEEYENRFHKYDDFIGLPVEIDDSDSE